MEERERERWEVVFTPVSPAALRGMISGSYIVKYIQSCQSLRERGEAELKSLRNRKTSLRRDKKSCVTLWLPELTVKHLPTSTVQEEKGTRTTVNK